MSLPLPPSIGSLRGAFAVVANERRVLFALAVALAGVSPGCGDPGTRVIHTTLPDLAVVMVPTDMTRGPDLAVGPCGTCPPESPLCDPKRRRCVGCLSDQDCPASTVCKADRCQPGCSAGRPQCGDAGSCDLDGGVCHGCLSDRDCRDGKTCEVVSGVCVACLPERDRCPEGSWCAPMPNGAVCIPGCRSEIECQQKLGANGTCCDHACVDVSTSRDHCGACGGACGNRLCCNRRCVDDQADIVNCGGCGKVCPSMNNQPQCKVGVCASGNCVNGFADCDNMPGNGCEVSIGGDRNNCGACGKVCAAADADAICLDGVCTIGACVAGFSNCNMKYDDGCEIHIAVDMMNCGQCGQNCMALPRALSTCMGGKCIVGVCDAGFGNCNNMDQDGCETNVTADQKNCGACGNACPGPANTLIVCTNGVCGAPMGCLPGFKDCDADAKNGCEIDLMKDPKNCGGCANSCGAAVNAAASCTDGKCSFQCSNGFGDCDGNKDNGCETVLATDKVHCGKCGNICPMNTPLCILGKCSNIVKSCKEIIDFGLSIGDGVYTIDPDGQGGKAPFDVYCEMTTDGGGWEVQAYIRAANQWDWKYYSDNGVVGDTAKGFSSAATLQAANDSFNEKIIIYLNIIEKNISLGKQWMVVRRMDNVAIPFNTLEGAATGWSFRDSYGKSDASAGNICTHGCATYRGNGMFHDASGIAYHGTQTGDNGCRDGNNICWMSRSLGCNVGAERCSYLTGKDEGVIYGVRNKQ